MLRTPTAVLMMTGQIEVMKITKIAEGWLSRNAASEIGSHASGEMVRRIWKIMIPAAAPYIFTGLRIGIGLSWLAIVAAEMLIGGVGIGFFIWDAWNSSHLPDIIVALVYIGVVGFLLDRLVAGIGAFVTRGTSAK